MSADGAVLKSRLRWRLKWRLLMPKGWCFVCHKGIGKADSHPQVRTVQVCSFCHQASQGHRNIAPEAPMVNAGSPSLTGQHRPAGGLIEDVVENWLYV